MRSDTEREDSLPFGQWVKRRRQALDLTQDDLAERVGCASPTIQKIEQGARRPSRALAERLFDKLGVDATERAALLRRARLEPGLSSAPPLAPPEPVAAELVSYARPSLPSEPTPFVGRDRELAGVQQQLADGAARLVTIVGPGGMGKTRLALRVAYALDKQFADGACWISLAAVPSAELLLASIADALGMTFPVTADVETHLLRSLRDRHMLLVLDNVEHLAGDSAPLARLIAAAPNVRFLVTSRVRLNLREEWVWELGGLPVPPPGRAAAPDSAIALFVQSARRVRQDFALSPGDMPTVARICALVDGMPLGIELAAAWSRLLSPQEIGAEIARSLDFLSSGMANVEDRHRSLRAVFRASWALLSPDEQAIARRLAVFQGGFTREAAQAVAGAALPQLLAMADKSFVRRAAGAAEGWRFDMHELIRQYAGEQLDLLAEERRATFERHSGYYADWLARAEGELKSAGQQAALARLGSEINNVRAAWEWLVDNRRAATIRRITPALAYFYELRAWSQEGQRALGRAAAELAAAGETGPADVAVAYAVATLNAGWFLMRVGETERGLVEARRSVELLRRHDDRLMLANALFGLGYIATLLGRYDEARVALDEGADLARAVDHPWMTAIILTSAGTAARAQGRGDQAAALLHAARRQWRRTGEPRGTAWCLNEIGALLLAAGQLGEAEATLQESISLSAGLADPWSSGTAYSLLGQLARMRGEAAEASWLLGQSLALFRSMDARAESAQVLLALAGIRMDQGTPGETRRLLGDALQAAASAGIGPLVLTVLTRIAGLLTREGDRRRAAELCARVLADGAASQETRAEAAALLGSVAPAALPPWSLDEAVAAGTMALRASPELAAQTPARPVPAAPELIEPLTAREREVLRLMAAGASNPEIAERLMISPHTAKVHVTRILAKLGVSSRTEAALRARDLGL